MEGFGHLDGCVVRHGLVALSANVRMQTMRHHEDRCTRTMSVLDTRVHVCAHHIGLELLVYRNNHISFS
jgi:hypothetical protein